MKIILFTVLRTLAAIILIATGILLLAIGCNWNQWYSNNEIPGGIVMILHSISLFLIVGGCEEISPILWVKIAMCIAQYKEDYIGLKNYKKELRELREKWLW